MKKYFVVSDVHSFYDELMKALDEKGFQIDNPDHYLVVAGDLFDRGPKTKELYSFVNKLGDRFIYVRGNHEDLLESCVADIVSGRSISPHHFSNGTVRTVAAFCDCSEWEIGETRRPEEIKQLVYTRTLPVLDFIAAKSKDYVELGDYIFVHGWVPTIDENLSPFSKKPLRLAPREWWDDQEDYSSKDLWKEARWTNGMQAWKDGCVIPGKTIICGHWHCSWGWSYLDQKYKEFPPKNRKEWEKSFQPYIKPGIMAIDACTAYSRIVNCIVIEENNGIFIKA